MLRSQSWRWTLAPAAGVMDAVAKGYLKNMYFGISQDAAGTQLLEVSKAIYRARRAGGWHSWL
jgi:hypothetical protein